MSELAEHFEAKKYAYRQTKDGMVVSFVIHPDDVPKEMATAPIGQRYIVACAKIDDYENPIRPQATTDGERALAKANLICRDTSYQRWVRLNKDEWPFINQDLDDQEYAAAVIRSVCQVSSRSELKTDEHARELLEDHLMLFQESIS